MEELTKKILVVDDSALMRSVLCDIINNDKRFHVEAKATNGLEAFDLLSRNTYDAVVLDVNMPKMGGIELLKELKKYKIPAKVMMASTDTKEGAQTTLDALELGAMDFVHKPDAAYQCKRDGFDTHFLETLWVVANSKHTVSSTQEQARNVQTSISHMMEYIKKHAVKNESRKLVAIASSTGGPKALQSLIPRLPKELDAPVLLVQHMPKGFTASLAERLDAISPISVKEAEEGETIQKGVVYVAMGGKHMNVATTPDGRDTIHYTDEPLREGVKPCANYMYESLLQSSFDRITCVVMTGMGADGTEGIRNLKEKKDIHVIAQDQESCVVYGMPKSIVGAGLENQVVTLEDIAQEIILNVGVTT